MRTPAQIIYLNGPSSSGKTTLAKALQHAFEEFFLHVGIDKIISWMPEKVNDWTGSVAPLGYSWEKSTDESGNLVQELQIGPCAKKIAKTFQEVVLTLAKMGHHLIIDDVSFGKKQVDEWKELLKGFSVLWIGVNAPLPVLEQREKERGNRIVGSARGQFHKVHADATYDLEIDTHHATIDENIHKIKSLAPNRKNRNQAPCFHFRPVDREHRSLVHRWLKEPHVAKWFYGQGLQNTFNHLDDFLNGSSKGKYWLGYDQKRPFALLVTSSVEKPDDELTKWCSKEGEAITLDLLIGATDYLGKGLSHIVIKEFLLGQFPNVTEVLIDPEATNSHAIHIYKKVGFTILGEFIPSHNPHLHYMMRLDMQKLARNSYHLEHYETIPYEEVLFRGISEEAFHAKALPPIRPFSIFIKDQKQNVLGGVSGTTFYGSLYVDSLWIASLLRHQGWGTKLMKEAEKIGKERGARFVTVNTMDWEALPFYKKLAYSVEFTREGYDKNSKMFMLRKAL